MALFPFLLLLLIGVVRCVDIQGVQLVGGTGEYMKISNNGDKYRLECPYRAGYDDKVEEVEWRIYGRPVYQWKAGFDTASVFGILLGHVEITPASNPQNLHFTKIAQDLAGNYTCIVRSTKGQQTSKPFDLKVVDISDSTFETHVNLINDTDETALEDSCTLMWDFSSPAIYPRPNVTCGYYSYDFDDVTTYLPAGLSLHQLLNGSWQAEFHSTKVQVKDIPVHGRLGCSIKIPQTTYKKLVKFQDDLLIDSKIDTVGCPAPEFSPSQNILYEMSGATITCRGDLVPTNSDTPATVSMRCPDGAGALFPNGTMETDWSMEITCSYHELVWRMNGEERDSLVDLEELPYCLSGYSGSSQSIFHRLDTLICILLTTFAYSSLVGR